MDCLERDLRFKRDTPPIHVGLKVRLVIQKMGIRGRLQLECVGLGIELFEMIVEQVVRALSFVPPSSKNRAFLPIFGRGVPLTCPTGCQNVEATVFFFEELKAYGESDLVEASGGSFIC